MLSSFFRLTVRRALTLSLLCLLSSCSSHIIRECGAPSLGAANIERTVKRYEAAPPSNMKEVKGLLGYPSGTSSDENGNYFFWESLQIRQNDKQSRSACAGCLSKNNQVILLYIKYLKPGSSRKPISLGSFIDPNYHPGMEKAMQNSFKRISLQESARSEKPVFFSPSGHRGVYLNSNQRLVGWKGETPVIETIVPERTTPASYSQPSTSPSIGNVIATSLISSLPGIIANTYAPTPVAAPAATTSSSSNPEWLQRLHEKNRRTWMEAEATKQSIYKDRAIRAGKINWGN